MLFQYLLTASFAVFTAVLVVRVSTTPEARLRYLGQLDTASKLSDVAHEIQFHSPFSEQVSPEFATNLKLPTVTLHPRASSSQRYIVGTSPVVPKLLIQFLDHLNYISTSRIGTPRKISGFVRIQSPWPLVKYWIQTILPPEAILLLASDLWLPHFGSLVLYIWRTALKLRLHLRWFLLWRHSQKWAMVLVVATETIADETALTKQASEDCEDLPQVLSAPVSETVPLHTLSSHMLPTEDSETEVLSANDLVRSHISQVLETVVLAPTTHNTIISPSDPVPPFILEKSIPLHLHLRRHSRNSIIAHGPMNVHPVTETTSTKQEVPTGNPSEFDSELPLLRPTRKRTRSYSRLRRHQREVVAHLTQSVEKRDAHPL